MKKISIILLFLFSLSFLYSASIDSGLISIRDDLFNSQEELESFYYQSKLTEEEEEYYQNMEVFLLTGGAGSLVWENFGHSSFVFKMPNGDEISFDYGIFSFDKGFYTNFALGRLYYSMLVSYAHYRVSSLIDDDRSVQYLKLDLDNIQKCNLARFLEYNAKSGNNVYLYNYYTDNCATRLRDSYNAVNNNRFRLWAEKKDMNETLRDYSKRYLSRSGFIIDWGINYLLGPNVDRKITLWEAMFLPDVLNNAISEFQNNTPDLIYKSENRDDTPNKYNFFLYSILFDLVFIVPIILLNSSS